MSRNSWPSAGSMCRMRRSVGLYCRTIDQKVRWWSTGAGECLEQIDPHALCRPADVAIVERLARSVDTRRIYPAPTGLQHLNDAAYDPAVIDARLASRVGRQMRRHSSELRVRKPEVISIDRLLPRGNLESRPQTEANGFMGLGPNRSDDSPSLTRVTSPSVGSPGSMGSRRSGLSFFG